MKLNHECVRDSLLVIESELPLNSMTRLSDFEKIPALTSYSRDELLYCLSKLLEAEFIHAKGIRVAEGLQDIFIQELTWNGHAFLDNVRDPKVWEKVKEKISFLKSVSIPIAAELGSKFAKDLLGLE